MSPIEYIEKGILNGNWETVCSGYELLTGKSLPPPKVSRNKAENALRNISQIVDTFYEVTPQDLLNKQEVEREKAPAKKPRGRPKKNKKVKNTISPDGEDSSVQIDDKKRTVEQSQTGKTQFITNEPDPEEVKSNAIKAAKTSIAKTALKRKPPRSYDVECNECKKTFKSDRPKGELGQKCTKCLSNNKSMFV